MSKIDMKRDNEKRFRSKLNRKHWRDYRLHELERQLEFAESRCGTLKQQLDYIKVLYGCGRPTFLKVEDCRKFFEKESLTKGMRRISYDDVVSWNIFKDNYEVTEVEENIKKCYLPQNVSHTNTTRASTNSSNKPISSKSSFEKREMVFSDNQMLSQKNMKLIKGKKKKIGSSIRHKGKSKTIETRYSNAICQTLSSMDQDPIVEIYKNNISKINSKSAGDLSYKIKKENIKSELLNTNIQYNNWSKSKKLNDSNENVIPITKFEAIKSLEKFPLLKEKCIQTDFMKGETNNNLKNERSTSMDAISRPLQNIIKSESNFYDSELVKNYYQPTISSKKKRVERNFLSGLNTFNSKNIPFIAATSTAPSHNIGVNIQQVLSIIKKGQHNTNNFFPIMSDQIFGEMCGQSQIGFRTAVNEVNEIEGNQDNFITELLQTESKKRLESSKSTICQMNDSDKESSGKMKFQEEIIDNGDNSDWICKVHKLKKVLMFLHEDFASLSQKYKKLQKKLFKRNINKADAKDELAEIERDLEKKEEEITIVIALYKEVLQLREELKKCKEKCNVVIYERACKHGTHTQMSMLLRKIQQFQKQMKK